MGRKDDLAVDLIDRNVPRAGQLDPHARMAARGDGLDRPDRCAEILQVEPARELRRELRVEKIHHQRIWMLRRPRWPTSMACLPAALTVSGKSNAMRLIG